MSTIVRRLWPSVSLRGTTEDQDPWFTPKLRASTRVLPIEAVKCLHLNAAEALWEVTLPCAAPDPCAIHPSCHIPSGCSFGTWVGLHRGSDQRKRLPLLRSANGPSREHARAWSLTPPQDSKGAFRRELVLLTSPCRIQTARRGGRSAESPVLSYRDPEERVDHVADDPL